MALQIIVLIVNLLICLGVPLVGTMVMTMRGKAPARPFLYGLGSYFLSGICVMSIMNLLFSGMPRRVNIWTVGILGGALLEEGVRFVMIQRAQKKQSEEWDGIAFGLGLGGLYGIWEVVIPNELILVTVLQTQKAAAHISVWELFSAGMNAASILAFHIGMSLLMYYWIKRKKTKQGFLLALACNVVLRAVMQIWPEAFPTTGVLCELCIAIIGVCVLAFGVRVVWNEGHKAEESNIPNRKGRRKQK